MAIICVEGLVKKFGAFTAVSAISFTVKKGEVFGFLGPNGAGKSTTISMLSTILPPSAGDATINGFRITRERDAVRRTIGLVFQDTSLDDQLTAEENLRFHARLYGIPRATFLARKEEVLQLVDLEDKKDEIVRTFSGGMKRRLEIARGLIHHPAVLFLDEPSIGLDPQTRAHLWEYILKLKEEKEMTIFMTTHYMDEAEYCDRIAIIDRGAIVALDTPAALKKGVGKDIVTLTTSALRALKKELVGENIAFREEGGTLRIDVDDGEAFLPSLLRTLKTPLNTVSLRKPTLDDVFLHLTGRAIRDEEASKKDILRHAMRMRPR